MSKRRTESYKKNSVKEKVSSTKHVELVLGEDREREKVRTSFLTQIKTLHSIAIAEYPEPTYPHPPSPLHDLG